MRKDWRGFIRTWGAETVDFPRVVALYLQYSERIAVSPSLCEALAWLQIKLELVQ